MTALGPGPILPLNHKDVRPTWTRLWDLKTPVARPNFRVKLKTSSSQLECAMTRETWNFAAAAAATRIKEPANEPGPSLAGTLLHLSRETHHRTNLKFRTDSEFQVPFPGYFGNEGPSGSHSQVRVESDVQVSLVTALVGGCLGRVPFWVVLDRQKCFPACSRWWLPVTVPGLVPASG